MWTCFGTIWTTFKFALTEYVDFWLGQHHLHPSPTLANWGLPIFAEGGEHLKRLAEHWPIMRFPGAVLVPARSNVLLVFRSLFLRSIVSKCSWSVVFQNNRACHILLKIHFTWKLIMGSEKIFHIFIWSNLTAIFFYLFNFRAPFICPISKVTSSGIF